MGSELVVSVLADKYVKKDYGPIYSEDERLNIVSLMGCKVYLCNAPGPQYLIRLLKPDIYARGADYIGKSMPEDKDLQLLNVKVRYTQSIPPTTSEIIQRIMAKQACLSS